MFVAMARMTFAAQLEPLRFLAEIPTRHVWMRKNVPSLSRTMAAPGLDLEVHAPYVGDVAESAEVVALPPHLRSSSSR